MFVYAVMVKEALKKDYGVTSSGLKSLHADSQAGIAK